MWDANSSYYVQESRYGIPTLLITKFPYNLLIPLVSKHTINVPFWNREIDNYVYGVFGFANKYLHADGAIVVFNDDDPRVLKEIKSYLEGNGYEIWSRWAIINVLQLLGMLGPAITSALVKEKMKNKRYVSAWGPLMTV
jgi:hypothetical protein